MTIAVTNKKITFREYLQFCETTNDRFELERGKLTQIVPPTWLHLAIAKFLERTFDNEIARLKYPWEAFREPGQQTEEDTARLPDVSVVPLDAITDSLDQTAVLTVAAILIVEIVSESTALKDYREKVTEYQAKGVQEYWIVDPDPYGAAKYIGSPKRPTVSVYPLMNGTYEVKRFQGSNLVLSPTFPELELTAEQILSAGR